MSPPATDSPYHQQPLSTDPGSSMLHNSQSASPSRLVWTYSRLARLDQLSWAQLNFTHNRRVSELTADKPDWINSAELSSTSLTTDESLNSQQTSQTGSAQLNSTELNSTSLSHNRRVSEMGPPSELIMQLSLTQLTKNNLERLA